MAWIDNMFKKRDLLTMIVGLAIIQLLACLLINRFMFCPVRGGYDKTIDGFVDIGTNGVAVAARVIGPQKGKKAVIYCHGNAEDLTALEGRFKNLKMDIRLRHLIIQGMDFLVVLRMSKDVTEMPSDCMTG